MASGGVSLAASAAEGSTSVASLVMEPADDATSSKSPAREKASSLQEEKASSPAGEKASSAWHRRDTRTVTSRWAMSWICALRQQDGRPMRARARRKRK